MRFSETSMAILETLKIIAIAKIRTKTARIIFIVDWTDSFSMKSKKSLATTKIENRRRSE